MAKQVGIALTFIIFLLLFTAVGIYSATRKQNTTTDYLLASRNVNPWLTALSAMATGQSGLLFIGQVGFAYKIGISSLWLTIGWAIGDYLAWYFIFKRLRQLSEETASDTVSSFLSQNMKGSRLIAIISAIITIVFLGSYAAAQLVAGSKALNAVFGWNYNLGIIIGAVIVVIYCFSGGIRASIWTDALQATIMIGSLLVLLVVAVASCGGTGQMWQSLAAIDPALINWNYSQQPWGFAPFFIGWIVAGFGVVGQPHIMVRAMAIDSADNIAFARNLKAALGLLTSISAMGIGLAGRVLIPDLLASGDPELALPYLSLKLLPVVLVGLMLAGLFSATMSTADSQILSCSAALTQDIFPAAAQSYKFAKVGTLTVTAVVLAIALLGNNNVFALVTFSWSALASGLGPLLILRVWQRPVNFITAIAMMGIGIATALIWNLGLDLSSAIYEVLPGMAAGMAVYGIAQFLKHPK
ncbi:MULTISPECIES: sodium/proline symporter [Moorena]|uniref:Sodium/proline symporter n=1 Tax=Moorena producens (strain JHB) TaxID=1454205 RepID=A0A1D9G196_MOOP1|nr:MULTISPECIES: sodium/proline symporter [Moorena]AOY81397.1 sodium/proline symporter [Moorena producens JHB]NER86203.1 sodium/proline symporter [Moorena sp. SIO3A2]NES41373.1 sodium/proline symporter [Moorena sp. SIO2C4]